MRATIKDIAKKANVSITTVSLVLNKKDSNISDETRNKIMKVVDELNYTPNKIAKGLITKKTNTFGLIIPDIANPFFPEIVRGVEDVANNNGYNLILCNTDDNPKKEEKYTKILIEKCVDGIIFISTSKSKDNNIKLLKKYNVPYVVLDRDVDNPDSPYIHTDDEKGMYEVVKFLIKNGHKKIAYISGPKENTTSQKRKNGYIKALKEMGIPIKNTIIREGNYKIDGGQYCIKSLLDSKEEFSAVACANDLMAIGAMEALKSRGILIPDDISLTGYDDIYISKITTPKLTTVEQPKYELGRISTETLLKIIYGIKVHPIEIKLEPKLIVRDSVAVKR
ncbi:LacI family DNA-binding transcriptional regulator [Caloramator proteoclasticus]|uniref:Transcriptional regulator, LacI family n=1 Tax=Caloramator proteoclasticus DSM 10124 TaxID=1121262 RepID=A0A1M5A1A5_9CLOT|nr:LacI family DNA-binding transcriptional regulator [Caloramator proteoclasticus]SHF23622.1 transcriptional regulator, LacI family [Caloramator proteoclasticus DSM 10124]